MKARVTLVETHIFFLIRVNHHYGRDATFFVNEMINSISRHVNEKTLTCCCESLLQQVRHSKEEPQVDER